MLRLRALAVQLAPLHRALYHANVIDHYENPRNVCYQLLLVLPAFSIQLFAMFDSEWQVGSLDKSKKSVGTGLVGAPACGDVMKLQVVRGSRLCFTNAAHPHVLLQIEVDASGVISNAVFKTFGCDNLFFNLLPKLLSLGSLSCGSAIASSSLATEWIKVRLFLNLQSALISLLFHAF
jgi:NifU-like protein involved in Fe-S cluster formation